MNLRFVLIVCLMKINTNKRHKPLQHKIIIHLKNFLKQDNQFQNPKSIFLPLALPALYFIPELLRLSIYIVAFLRSCSLAQTKLNQQCF